MSAPTPPQWPDGVRERTVAWPVSRRACFSGTALVFGVFSYSGVIDVTFVSCRRVVPDPAFLARCLQSSYDELLEAVDAATVTKSR